MEIKIEQVKAEFFSVKKWGIYDVSLFQSFLWDFTEGRWKEWRKTIPRSEQDRAWDIHVGKIIEQEVEKEKKNSLVPLVKGVMKKGVVNLFAAGRHLGWVGETPTSLDIDMGLEIAKEAGAGEIIFHFPRLQKFMFVVSAGPTEVAGTQRLKRLIEKDIQEGEKPLQSYTFIHGPNFLSEGEGIICKNFWSSGGPSQSRFSRWMTLFYMLDGEVKSIRGEMYSSTTYINSDFDKVKWEEDDLYQILERYPLKQKLSSAIVQGICAIAKKVGKKSGEHIQY